MQAPLLYEKKGQRLWLTADRSVFWETEDALIVSDLHVGKTGHFRKEGIGMPQALFREDLQRLFCLVQHFQPRHLVIVGDLFHSRENREMDLFRKWRNSFPSVHFHLVKGNHDILDNHWYEEAGLSVYEETFMLNGFCFIHDIMEAAGRSVPGASYFFSGHLHPGIRIHGLGKQSLRFPCFYFCDTYAVLPAFSRFTGAALIDPEKTDSVFAIVENKIIRMQ